MEYELVEGYNSKIKLTSDEIVDICDNSIAKLNEFIAHNSMIAGILNADFNSNKYTQKIYNLDYVYRSLKISSSVEIKTRHIAIKQHETPRYTVSLNAALDTIKICNEYFSTLIKKAKQARDTAKACRKFGKNKWFPKFYDVGGAYKVNCVSFSDAVVCPSCHKSISIKRMEQHQKAFKCIQRGRLNALREKNFMMVQHGSSVYGAIMDGKLPQGELLAVKYEAYVPDYMYTTIEEYNKDPKKFAGLTVVEVLNKMYNTN